MKRYLFFAGTNGSGKTTLIRSLMKREPYSRFRYICADEIEKDLQDIADRGERMCAARDAALFLREAALERGEDIIFESVASHPSHLADLERIRAAGYTVETFYVTTESPELNLARIARRRRDNDVYLNADRVRGRYARSVELLGGFLERSDVCAAFDNSVNYTLVFCKAGEGRPFLFSEKRWVRRAFDGRRDFPGFASAGDVEEGHYLAVLREANLLVCLFSGENGDECL